MYRSCFAALLMTTVWCAGALEWEKSSLEFELPTGVLTAKGSFQFTNTGEEMITITDIKTNCGCTTATLTKRAYAPGERGMIEAELTLQQGETHRSRFITVFSTDRPKGHVLTIAARAPKLVDVSPRMLIWSHAEGNVRKSVVVSVEADQPIHITDAESTSSSFQVKIETVKKGRLYHIHITPTTTEVKATARISLMTDFPEESPIVYSCYARVLETLGTKP